MTIVDTLPITTEDLKHFKLDEKISHLPIKIINEIITKYYSDVKIKDIVAEYDLKIHNNELLHILPPVVTNEECPYCKTLMLQKRHSKTVVKSGYFNQIPYCPNCNHSNSDSCSCVQCSNNREKIKLREIKRKRQLIEKTYHKSNFEFTREEILTEEDLVYLSTLLRANLSENTYFVTPFSDETLERFTPIYKLTNEVIKHLTGRNIIKPHPMSDIKAFEQNEQFPNVYYIYEVHYQILIEPEDLDYKAMIERLLYPSIDNFNVDFCYEMWRKIALNECLQYLDYQLTKVNFRNDDIGEKTISVFNKLLDHFSVSQIYNIIYRSISNATKAYQEGNITKKHARNIVISSCENFGHQAISNKWNINGFKRDYNLPQSILSKTFFNTILKMSDEGFYQKPSKEYLLANTDLKSNNSFNELEINPNYVNNMDKVSEVNFLSEIKEDLLIINDMIEEFRTTGDREILENAMNRLEDTRSYVDSRLVHLLFGKYENYEEKF